MSTASDLQALLRFLTQDAKVPLATALAKVKDLQAASLTSAETLAKCKPADIAEIFPENKVAKQIISAAKRVSKKRAATSDESESQDTATASPKTKKARGDYIFSRDLADADRISASDQEETLALPTSTETEDELRDVVLITNRAPLVLAFVVTLLKHTMPEQPLSSRLSLAQAYVAITSRARAVNLGIEQGASAEDEGFGEGQPMVTIMSKEIRVLRRWGYEWIKADPDSHDHQGQDAKDVEPPERVAGNTAQEDTNPTKTGDHETSVSTNYNDDGMEANPALWALDLEALKSKSTTVSTTTGTNLPIYTPQSARAYLFKSFESSDSAATTKKSSAPARAAAKEQNLGRLLKSLDLLYDSWADHLSPAELDRRTWSWYVQVRPEVQDGVAGWGGRNELKLSKILALRRGT